MSDDEEQVVDPEAEKLKSLLPITVRQNDLPEHLFIKVQLLLKDALAAHKMEKDIA